MSNNWKYKFSLGDSSTLKLNKILSPTSSALGFSWGMSKFVSNVPLMSSLEKISLLTSNEDLMIEP